MMNMLAAAIRVKNKPKSDTGLILRPQYPQYVLYDSEGEEVECNLATVKMSYGSSRSALTENANPNRGFWLNRTKMEKNLIVLIGALFLVTLGLMVAVALFAHNSNGNDRTVFSTVKITSPKVEPNQQNITQSPSNGNTNPTNDTSNSSNPITSANPQSTQSILISTNNNQTETSSTIPTSLPVNTSNSTDNKPDLSEININSISRLSSAINTYKIDNEYKLKNSNNNNNLNNVNKLENPSDICNTTACQTAGKLIRDAINASVDPCDDFYEFACGGWMATHTIPKDKSRYGNFDALDEKLQNSLKKELSEPSKKSDSFAVVYASDFYKACVDEATLESRGVSPLISALNVIGGWPIIGDKSVYKDSTYDWKDSLAKIIGHLSSSYIFSITVQPDSNETLVNRIYFDASSFGLGRNQLVNTTAYPDIVNAYKKYILQTAILLGAKNDSQTHQDIEDILNFESKLATLSTPPEDRRDAKVWYNRMPFNVFNDLTSNRVDWLNLTNRIYATINSTIRLTYDELIIVEDIPYYKGVTKLLESTPNRVIANYFGWMSAMSLGDFTVKQFRENEFEFNKINSGVEEETPLWKVCVNYLETALEYAVSRKYVDENFTKKDKEEATVMVKDLKESFRALVNVSDWLDDKTKQLSLHKLNAIIENVGYPEWLLNNEELDKIYNLTQKIDPKKAFEGLLYVEYMSAFNEFESIKKPVNRTLNWPMPPAIVNAAYEPTQNSITIPAGILKSPFFDSQRPAYMNFGAIGLVVGHEITHGFDDEGSQFDENGDLINWWSDKIRERFDVKSDCFIDEYSSYYDSEAKMHLNGNNTVGENIADNGGLRESFKAYQSYVKQHGEPPRLPYVSQYTPEQVFFLSYANTWCSLIRPEALKTMIQYNPHSPAKYRVNVPFSNFIGFSDVYGCKADSRMNPKNKCVLW